jgi:hypothetical protein
MTAPLKVTRAGSPLWPGITEGFDARCTCTWAMLGGVYQVKAEVIRARRLEAMRAVLEGQGYTVTAPDPDPGQ